MFSVAEEAFCDAAAVINRISDGAVNPGSQGHKCPVCAKVFVSTKGLQQHQIIHTDKKPFVCNTCGKAFRFKSNLFEHRSVHTGAHPYVCQFCGKSCRLKGNLKKHLKTHSKDAEIEENYSGPEFGELSSNDGIVIPSAAATTSKKRKVRKKPKLDHSFDEEFMSSWNADLALGTSLCEQNSEHSGIDQKDNIDSFCASLASPNIKTSPDLSYHVMMSHGTLETNRNPQRLSGALLSVNGQRYFKVLRETKSMAKFLEQAKSLPFEEDAYGCNLCGKTFTVRRELQKHAVDHNQTDSLFCKICLKFFDTSRDHEKHMYFHNRIHNMEKCGMVTLSHPTFRTS